MVPYPAALDLPHALVEWVTMLIVTREGDRLGDGRTDYSPRYRPHDVNVQVITDPDGRLLWISLALPGRTHDLTAARTHRIIRICERQGVPILAHLAHQGAGPWLTTGITHRPPQEPTPAEEIRNRAQAAARAPVERCRKAEFPANLPQVPMQPQPQDVNC